MHTIIKSQFYTVQTPVLVRVLYLEESDVLNKAVYGMQIIVLASRMQD